MNRTLSEHISFLEKRLAELNDTIMRNKVGLAERNKIEADIRAAQLALEHYRQAVALEKSALAGQ